jgi:type II secretory pathway component PulL
MSLFRPRKIAKLRGHGGWASVFFGESALESTTVRGAGHDVSAVDETAASLPASDATGDVKSRWQSAAQELRRKFKTHDYRFVTAVCGEDVLFHTLRLPSTQIEELKQMVDLQIDNLTPLPLEDVVYGFEPLEEGNGETTVLVAVAPKAVVNERVEVLEKAGLPPEVVGIETLALFRNCVRKQMLPTDEKLNAFVQVAPTAANIIVHTKGIPCAIRSVVFGTAAWNGVENRATLLEELQRTFVASEAGQPDRGIGSVTLTTWNKSLQTEVEELARAWHGSTKCYTNGSMPSPTASLCVETAEAKPPQLNLLPDEWRKRRRAKQWRRQIISGGIALAAVYLLGLATFLTLIWNRQSQFNDVNTRLTRREPDRIKAMQLQQMLETLQKQLDTKYSGLEVLREVSMLMPEGVKLSGFTFKKDQSVNLKAQAQTAAVMNDFRAKLEQSDLFSKVGSPSSHSDPTGLTKFDVTCTLKSAAPLPGGTPKWP